MNVTVTDTAALRLVQYLGKQGEDTLFLTTASKGCGGLKYDLGAIDADEVEAQDYAIDLGEGYRLIVDGLQAEALDGIVVDWEEGQFGGKFSYRNPNAASYCGCGQSFSTKGGC